MHHYINRLRSSMSNPLVTLGRLPGVLSIHELGETDIAFCDGTQVHVNFLVSQLEFSRWTVVSLLPDSGVESLLRGLVDHYGRFEGIPAVAAFVAPNGILERPDFGEPSSRFAFANAVLDLGIAVQTGCARKRVIGGGPVVRVKKWFFESGRFVDRQHASEQLGLWQQEINAKWRTGSGRIEPATQIAEERAHLRPMTVDSDHFAVRVPVMIGAHAQVNYKGTSYDVPYDMAHRLAALHLYPNKLIIVAGERAVEHERRPGWQ